MSRSSTLFQSSHSSELRPSEWLGILQDPYAMRILKELQIEGASSCSALATEIPGLEEKELETKLALLCAAGLVRKKGEDGSALYTFRKLAWLRLKNNWMLGMERLEKSKDQASKVRSLQG